MTGDPTRRYVQAQLRCAAMRARLAILDIDTIGIALGHGWITPDCALEWLAECGAIYWMHPTSPGVLRAGDHQQVKEAIAAIASAQRKRETR